MKRWKRKGWAVRALKKFPEWHRVDFDGRYFIRPMTLAERKSAEMSKLFNDALLRIYEPEIVRQLNNMSFIRRVSA